MGGVETRRLRLLLELSRLGSMRSVADELGITTSTVSQQIAVLSREAGTALIEADGRRVRLTPAGRRLAGHAVTILAAVEAARLDLDPGAEPAEAFEPLATDDVDLALTYDYKLAPAAFDHTVPATALC